LKIQVGGGLRREQDVAEILELGAERAVIGSTAVRDPAQVKSWIGKFGGDRILLALDVRWVETEYRVAVSGWTETAKATLWDTLAAYRGSGLRYVLCTDIGRDGMLTGPNLMLYRELVDRMPKLNIQASGGVGKRADLKQLQQTHVSGAIVGKALLDGQVELEVLERGAFGK
jgi:phosphoribosylformimino-5-aminoimidazole carboxamide ribotide isomerase